MSIAKQRKVHLPDIDSFAADGYLVNPRGVPVIHLHEAIALIKKLGRPLTEKEVEQFMV